MYWIHSSNWLISYIKQHGMLKRCWPWLLFNKILPKKVGGWILNGSPFWLLSIPKWEIFGWKQRPEVALLNDYLSRITYFNICQRWLYPNWIGGPSYTDKKLFWCLQFAYGGFYNVQDYMGRCILTLTRVILEGEYKECFQLDEAKSGKLNLHLKWMPQPVYRDSWLLLLSSWWGNKTLNQRECTTCSMYTENIANTNTDTDTDWYTINKPCTIYVVVECTNSSRMRLYVKYLSKRLVSKLVRFWRKQ